jgi:hypothetical protein
MGALRERIREGPPSLADAHKAYDDQCREELEKIDREVVEVPVDLSHASPGSLNTASLRDTWPGPYMKNQATGRKYDEWELWALAEELIDLAIGHLGLTGEDDWSDFTSPFGMRPHTGWRAEAWSAYYETSGEFD